MRRPSIPTLLTAAEMLQYEGYLRCEDTNTAILALARDGMPSRRWRGRTGHCRKLVRQVVRGEWTDIFRTRQSSLDAHLSLLDEQWVAGFAMAPSSGAACMRAVSGDRLASSRNGPHGAGAPKAQEIVSDVFCEPEPSPRG